MKTSRLYLILLSLLSLAFLNTAWVADDAFITFRVIDNTLAGHGLVWNLGERVQVYTHPLWFFLLLAGSALYNDPYYVCLIVSALCLIATFWIALKTLHPCGALAFLILLSLFLSRAFVDYMTSGLENPLSYLLVALFLWVYFKRQAHRHYLFLLTLIAAAMYLNRPDAIVLIFPALLHAFLTDKKPWRARTGVALAALSPVIAWTLFSLVYYGAPAPNTALAKTATGIGAGKYCMQAFLYVVHSLKTDSLTIFLLAGGGIAGFTRSSRHWKALSSGILLWGVYLCVIGGDYMAGRFFSVPVLFAAIILAAALRECLPKVQYWCGTVAAAILLVSLPQLSKTLFSPVSYDNKSFWYGIADERGFYYAHLGLRPVLKNGGIQHPWRVGGARLKNNDGNLYVGCVVGMAPYAGGPGLRWIDLLVLADAFRARLPAYSGSRVGHYSRAMPDGYLESILTGQNKITDPALAALYDDVLLATTGELFRGERFMAIFRLNTGFHKNAAANFDREAAWPPGTSRDGCTWRIDGPEAFTRITEIQ
ncbi:MAG: glycosyltransferase family 39 protein [Zoogloeaceae bacterium]|jgi:arabinofuranosyltransferase|nr:glycosyltransferase family 39 protein [Zoogloeaceae bacterium]